LENLDEPLDEGLIVELSYAKMRDKFIIGLRTDVRNLYNFSEDNLKGIHFPVYQCDEFISYYMSSKILEERK